MEAIKKVIRFFSKNKEKKQTLEMALKMVEIERLKTLDEDINFALEKRHKKDAKYNFPDILYLGEENCKAIKGSSVIIEYCALLDYLERGDLIFKDAKVQSY